VATRFELVYGKSGTAKTTWWMTIAEELFRLTGQTTRLYIGDGGLATVEDAGLMEDKIVEACVFNERDWPFTTVRQISQGAWPNAKNELVPLAQSGADNVGLWVFEGLTVMSDYIMGSAKGGLADRAGKGEKIGQDSPIMVQDPSGEKFGGNAMAHWNFAQRRIIDAIQASKALPGFVIWTAHERAAEDKEDGNEKIIGPAAAGKALTAQLPLWFGNTIHMTTATKKVKQKDPATGKDVDQYIVERRAYTRDHADPDGTVFVKYLANTRCPLVNGKNPMPEYLSPPDPLRFYAILKEAKDARREARSAAVAAS
jgi:hypothetical protein